MTNHFLEVIMSTTSITHRPASFVTAAAAVLALTAGGVALSISQRSGNNPSAPAQPQSQTQYHPNTPQSHHFHATTSGGKVMLGQ
jgi:hypothetical protein